MISRPHYLCLLYALLLPLSALAERSDREQQVNLEADKASMDDAKKILSLEGNVVLSQGSMSIRASRVIVTQDNNGFQKGIAYGSKTAPAHFKQKREGRNDFIEGEAERIEHDARTEKTEFFNHAQVKSGGDEVTGNFIAFDGVTERYVVTNNGSNGGRVRAVIHPKTSPPLPLK